MKPIRAVIFDLDGTLLDTLDNIAAAVNCTLAAYDMPPRSREQVRSFVGNGVKNLIDRAVADGTDEQTTARVLADFKPYYAEHTMDFTVPYDGIPEMLAQLKADGVKLAVMSNKNHSHILKMVNALFPDTFDSIWGTIPEVPAKPNPARAFMIADEFGEPIENIAFVGDSDVDMITACNAKAIPIGVAWGYRPADCLRENGAKYTPENADKLYEILKNL
jgi:phosphoglycolate phosphatase